MNQEPLSAAQRWRWMLEAEHAQSNRARGQTQAPGDFWEPFADRFRPDPHDTSDPVFQRLLQEVRPHHTVIDVGAGAGRVALPLSLHCHQVIAVEPSASMGAILTEEAQRHHRHNITLIPSTWEDASIAPADIIMCVQVLYTVRDIVPFIRKLEAHARERVLIVLYDNPPQFQAHPLWPGVHGEERLRLPCLKELMQVLWEMGMYPNLEMLPLQEHRGFESRERALQQLSPRLLVMSGSEEEQRLRETLKTMLEEREGRLRIKGLPPFRPALVWWQTRAQKHTQS